MGPDGDTTAVVDSRLRVRGVAALRVADASVMPEVVNAPTHAACLVIGEKCADLISGR
jgi:choline dehydrogenase